MNKVLWVVIVVISLLACKKDNKAPNFYFDYYPVEKGHYVTYAVREVYVDNGMHDTTEYFLKAQIGDTFTDNEGRIANRYNRYVSQSLNGPWVLKDIWTVILNGNKVELIEENQRTIKLVLAPDIYKDWNCNAYNISEPLDCYYRDIHKSASMNGFDFDSTVTVEQDDNLNMVVFSRKYEQYAKGIGMYHKYYKDYTIQNFDTVNVVKGNEIIMKLVDYGDE